MRPTLLHPHPLSRRDFINFMGVAATVSSVDSLSAQATASAPKVPLGLDAHSVRAMGWKARQLIDYAAEQKLDAVLFNTLKPFESLDSAHLRSLRETAAARGLRINVGVGSVAEGSTVFSKENGNAETLLALGVRVATDLGSPVVNCRIGALPDRSTPGGIEARTAELLKVLKAVRSRALDAGVKFAVENHAGDLRSEELLQLIQAAGTDVAGVMLDPGNAVWAMEDPMRQIDLLGRHVLCTSVRDWMVWESPEGATFQWTAIGEGLMDVPAFLGHMTKLCPGVPLHLEIISNSPRPIPFLRDDHWQVYPNLRASGIVDFLALCRRGRPLELVKPPAGTAAKTFEQQHQRAEFERSVATLRRLGAGLQKI
ncbi:MAG: sugar phosphate isomerase/epimerase [Opitutaceae bacterium]|nr:sugar phosphate isomerase/epimerase [Opitutaceae bacterium]